MEKYMHLNRSVQVNNNTNYGGVGFLGLLTILFIALKLLEVINWSWWWVLSPLWIPTAVFFGFLALILAWAALASLFTK